MTLDGRSPSPVFRYGGMALGVLSMLSVLGAHLVGLNPYFSGELLGSLPFFDLLLIGYLLPAIGYFGLAWYARGRRPLPYVVALAVSGAILAFAWATLSVRRFWQGQNVADWKGFLQGETYTIRSCGSYSACCCSWPARVSTQKHPDCFSRSRLRRGAQGLPGRYVQSRRLPAGAVLHRPWGRADRHRALLPEDIVGQRRQRG